MKLFPLPGHRIFTCFAITLALLPLLLTGCAKGDKDELVGVDGDFVTGSPLPERREGVSFLSSNVSRGDFPSIYFPYDSFSISGGEAAKLDQTAATLRQTGNEVIIAGFTDERGTEEYNRVLGERRALAVRDGLIERGVSGAKLQTVSFGMEMPADPSSNEAAWAKNRRAEFGVVR